MRRIKSNVWDNWSGYEGSRKVKEFGLDQTAAVEWCNGTQIPTTRLNQAAEHILYSQSFRLLNIPERIELVRGIMQTIGTPEGAQEAVNAILTDYQPE